MFSRATETHPGRRALDHIEHLLKHRPHVDGHELAEAMRCLAQFREEMLETKRAGRGSDRDRRCLSHLNAVISVVMSMHFPIGNPPWEEFAKTRDWLRDCIAESEG